MFYNRGLIYEIILYNQNSVPLTVGSEKLNLTLRTWEVFYDAEVIQNKIMLLK